MTKPLSLTVDHVCERPEAPEAFTVVEATVSTGGEALFLFIENDPTGEVRATEKIQGARFPQPRMRQAKAFRLYIVGSAGARFVDIPPLDFAFPHVDLFPDGRILIAGTRSQWRGPEDFDKNGAIFDPETGRVDRILLGDGLADLAVDGLGRIWASYFDEGVFGNFGWGRPGPPGPGSGGLVCFNAAGEILWSFNQNDSKHCIDDCYAMHASKDKVVVFYYSDFHVCEVDMNFTQSFYFPNRCLGSSRFAAFKTAFLFGSSSKRHKYRMNLVLRTGGKLGKSQPVRLDLPDRRRIGAGKFIGRGESLHILNEHGWFRAGLAALEAVAG